YTRLNNAGLSSRNDKSIKQEMKPRRILNSTKLTVNPHGTILNYAEIRYISLIRTNARLEKIYLQVSPLFYY
ncbi:MAG: hypothetical protein WBY22_12605, partial [Nitrososphaeraceae archaeon]